MTLEELQSKALKCEKCLLFQTRTNVVFGEGSSKAEIMFIGEGPGQREDELGRPFVGSAGKLLDELIESIGFKREELYIANIVKCRPPQNRDPLPKEVEACKYWLEKQIEIIKPILIVLLGRHSMDRFLPNQKISVDHGKPKRCNGQIYFPVYHPAAALYRNELISELKKDFEKIPKVLDMAKKIIVNEKDSINKKEERFEQVRLGI